jgi:hypothetical protein
LSNRSSDGFIGEEDSVSGHDPRQSHGTDGLAIIVGVDRDVLLPRQALGSTGSWHGIALGDTREYALNCRGFGH